MMYVLCSKIKMERVEATTGLKLFNAPIPVGKIMDLLYAKKVVCYLVSP
jgi:hypothetical protein